MVTTAQTSCGSGILTGPPAKFGIPHGVVLYLNGGNGYANNVNGLFQLANDVLGGANTAINALDAQYAAAAINNAFDGCRMLTGTISYKQVGLITKVSPAAKANSEIVNEKLLVTAFPNPYNKQFSLSIISPISGMATIEFFTASGTKVFELRQPVSNKIANIVPYNGPHHSGALIYKVSIGDYHASGFVIGID